jgi:glycosyltransferase involved in cell wall biosynthesis
VSEPAGSGDAVRTRGRYVLVVSTVHQAEDPRIRWRTVAALAASMPVRYATKGPGPADRGDHEWVRLPGGRLRRAVRAVREACRRDVAVVSLHDPELLPAGILLRLLRRVPVVFDVHEDVPAQISTKERFPLWVRAVLARVAAVTLRLAERVVVLTLAEPNYRPLFRGEHPVLPNYPDLAALPAPQPSDGTVVYVGDVTEIRGAVLAVEAVAGLADPPPLRLVGRCAPELAARLSTLAAERGVDLDLPGFVPHPQAMAIVARAAVGLSPLADVPNYRRSLPTKTLEYLAMGVPVVASDLEGTAAVIGDMEAVDLVAPGDVEAWRDGLRDVLADPAVRERAAAQAPTVRATFRFRPGDVRDVYARLFDASA